MMVRIEARISSIEGSCARWARRSASVSRSLEFELTALIRSASIRQTCRTGLEAGAKPRRNRGRISSRARVNAHSASGQAPVRLRQALFAVRRPHPDPLGLDLIVMNARIVLGDAEAQGRHVEASDLGEQRIGIDHLVVFGRDEVAASLQEGLLSVE